MINSLYAQVNEKGELRCHPGRRSSTPYIYQNEASCLRNLPKGYKPLQFISINQIKKIKN